MYMEREREREERREKREERREKTYTLTKHVLKLICGYNASFCFDTAPFI